MTLTMGKLIALFGGWSIIVAGLCSWFVKILNEKLFSKWRTEEGAKLEKLRAEVGKDRLLLESASKSFQSGNELLQQKRLASVELLWAEVLRLRERFSAPVFFFSILVPSEYDKALTDGGPLEASVRDIDDPFITGAIKDAADLEKDRPYLGETLWLQFFIYRAFLGRLAFLILQAKKKGQFKGDWREDSGVRQLLSHVLDKGYVDALVGRAGGSILVNAATGALEDLMLKEIALISSGKRSATESFENATELRKVVATIGSSGSPLST